MDCNYTHPYIQDQALKVSLSLDEQMFDINCQKNLKFELRRYKA